MDRILVWEWLEQPGIDVARVRAHSDGCTVEGHAVAAWDATRTLDLRYRWITGPDGALRDVTVDCWCGGPPRTCTLRRDRDAWWLDGARRPDLDAAVDIDIMGTPSTNTLPVRRLIWRPGQARLFTMTYIRIPTLEVEAVAQRYTALAGGNFRFESFATVQGAAPGASPSDADFQADLSTDAEGFATHYPPHWRRRD